jgi:hypothetical protein
MIQIVLLVILLGVVAIAAGAFGLPRVRGLAVSGIVLIGAVAVSVLLVVILLIFLLT